MRHTLKYITAILLLIGGTTTSFSDLFYPDRTAIKAPALALIAIPILNHNAKNISALINDRKLGLLSNRGATHIDPANHRLWVHDDSVHIKKIERIILKFNPPQKQIILRARIVSIDSHYLKSLGVMFTSNTQATRPNTNKKGLSALQASIGLFTLPLAKLSSNQSLDLKLTALQQQGHAHVISKPELVTLNGKTALIEAGEEVPYQETTSSGATNVAFKKAVLRLKVTAHISSPHDILLSLNINQDKVSALTVNGVPAIHTQQISTQVHMQNNQTLVLGGILEQTQAHQVDAVPLLSKIPLIGAIFQHHRRQHEEKELLVFITPQIVS